MKILKDIHKSYGKYLALITKLEDDLSPYLDEYLLGDRPHIMMREDEGCKLFIVDSTVGYGTNYLLDEDRIKFIKKNKRIN